MPTNLLLYRVRFVSGNEEEKEAYIPQEQAMCFVVEARSKPMALLTREALTSLRSRAPVRRQGAEAAAATQGGIGDDGGDDGGMMDDLLQQFQASSLNATAADADAHQGASSCTDAGDSGKGSVFGGAGSRPEESSFSPAPAPASFSSASSSFSPAPAPPGSILMTDLVGQLGELFVYRQLSALLPGFGESCWTSSGRVAAGLPAPACETTCDFRWD